MPQEMKTEMEIAEPTFEQRQRAALSCAKKSFADARQAARVSVQTSAGAITINAGPEAAANLAALIRTAEADAGLAFRAADNSFATVTKADLPVMLAAVDRRNQALYQLKWQLTEAINAAETTAALDAIDIGGWFAQPQATAL